jgi:hypothetical protein
MKFYTSSEARRLLSEMTVLDSSKAIGVGLMQLLHCSGWCSAKHMTKIISPLPACGYNYGMDTKVQTHLQPGWVQELLEPDAYPHAVGKIHLIETHISWVFLTGNFAYKIKKPVDLGFLDFTTLAQRKFFCEEELRLNQRTTGDFYLGVVSIGMVDGHAKVGSLPAVEYAVHMRQFPPDARLDRRLAAERVTAEDLRKLALLLAAFHTRLTPATGVPPEMAAERASAPALNNFEHIRGSHISKVTRRQIDRIRSWTREQAEIMKPVFKQRAARGFIRECHGDLHLANLFERDGCIYPYDGLEFDPNLRWIDPVSDIAFLVMDLTARGRMDLAYIFLNAWLEETGDYDGLPVLRFYLVYRSMVRLKVASIQTRLLHEDARGEHAIKARHYLELARSLVKKPAHPRLILMHGLSASGKTHTSAQLITALPGIRVRSDLERKRMHGLPRHHHPAADIDSDLYSGTSTDRTYTILAGVCETGLKAGFNMIVDATFSKRQWRTHFLDLAHRLNARPAILVCSAPVRTLQARIRQRAAEGLDESDADPAVLQHQLAHFEPLDPAEYAVTVKDPNDLATTRHD